MKQLAMLTILFSFLGCASTVLYEGENEEKSKRDILKFSEHLESVVEQHHAPHFITHVEAKYKTEQLVENIKNDSTQFVNEFFCGKSTEGQFMCFDFDKIVSIDLIKIKQDKNGIFILNYKLVNAMGLIIDSEVFLDTNKEKFFLYSAIG